eukprot:7250256-Pyramimonas_sp.AAC.1
MLSPSATGSASKSAVANPSYCRVLRSTLSSLLRSAVEDESHSEVVSTPKESALRRGLTAVSLSSSSMVADVSCSEYSEV